jgi:membrane protein YdbS with pleckstrin-like domain
MKMLEITINVKQLIAVLWTMIAIVISVIVVLGVGLPYWQIDGTPLLMVAAVFGVWLLVALPVFLLIAVWQISSPKSAEE